MCLGPQRENSCELTLENVPRAQGGFAGRRGRDILRVGPKIP